MGGSVEVTLGLEFEMGKSKNKMYIFPFSEANHSDVHSSSLLILCNNTQRKHVTGISHTRKGYLFKNSLENKEGQCFNVAYIYLGRFDDKTV